MSEAFSAFLSPNVLTNEGLSLESFNSTFGGDASDRRPVFFDVVYGNPALAETRQLASNPSFTNQSALGIALTVKWGSNFYGGGTTAKWTYVNLSLSQVTKAAGQKIVQTSRLTSYGMGDNALETRFLTFAGGPIAGDEGTGFNLVSAVSQQASLALTTILSVVRASLATTITQDITAAALPQTVTVASSAGASAGDWLVIGQAVENGSPNIEAVEVISVATGTITAIFACNHSSGATVKPALVLDLDNGGDFGEQRTIVNLDGTSYSTGTVSSIAGGGFVGSGTSWAANIVGGDALNIGAICLDADTQSAAPFNGTGVNGPLKSWYNITSVTNTTHLGIHSFSVANDQGYNGDGPGAGGYVIKPAARILRMAGEHLAVCEYSAHTWTAGDDIECVICPYPDVSGFQYSMSVYTPGGIRRSAMNFRNGGTQPFSAGYSLDRTGTGGWEIGVSLSGTDTGIQINNAQTYAIRLDSELAGADSDNAGKIDWNGTYIMPNSANLGMDQQLISSGTGGKLSAISNSIIGSGSLSALKFTGMIGTPPGTVSLLPTASSDLEGLEANVTNSNTDVWGATVAGGGANHVKVRCNGSAWTVVGK